MKNITVFTVLVIMLHCAQFAFTQEESSASYAVSTWPEFGMLFGQAKEIVFPFDTKAELLSLLTWDIKPVFYYGLALDFSRAQPLARWGIFANLSLKNGLPGISGKMEDQDWMSKEYTSLTHYSVHDNFTEKLFFFDISAGFSFPLKHILLMKTYLTVSYMYVSFYAENGYYEYTPPFGDGKKHPINGKVINYTQDWLIITPGLSLGYFFNTRFYTELVFQISPLVFCNDLDEHLKTGIQYRDYMRGGLFIEPGLHFSYIVGKRLELSLKFTWRYIDGTKGETYAGALSTQIFEQQGEAGAGLSVIGTGLCLKIRL
jgi:outer membrane protease